MGRLNTPLWFSTCLPLALFEHFQHVVAHILIRLSSDLKFDSAADFGKRLMVVFREKMDGVACSNMVFRNHWRNSQYEPSTAYLWRKWTRSKQVLTPFIKDDQQYRSWQSIVLPPCSLAEFLQIHRIPASSVRASKMWAYPRGAHGQNNQE